MTQADLLVAELANVTADTRLVYQYDGKSKIGTLYYDDDGSGADAMIAVAKLTGVASLVAVDFAIG